MNKKNLPGGDIMNLSKYINNLKEYREESFRLLEKEWNPKKELFEKVDENGNYKKFEGDTIVFTLDKSDIEKVSNVQKALYSKLHNLLARPLSMQYFHMTLHDLCNFTTTNDIQGCIEKNKKIIPSIFKKLPKHDVIKMKSIGLYNGGSAIGIMFAPVDEKINTLFNIRKLFDSIIEQKEMYIPHVTLGYYLPHEYSDLERKKLLSVLVNTKVQIEISLKLSKLTYQIFYDMDHYENVYNNQ